MKSAIWVWPAVTEVILGTEVMSRLERVERNMMFNPSLGGLFLGPTVDQQKIGGKQKAVDLVQ